MRGKYISKEVFLRHLLLRLLSLRRYVSSIYTYAIYICIFLHESDDDYLTERERVKGTHVSST